MDEPFRKKLEMQELKVALSQIFLKTLLTTITFNLHNNGMT
jgi:hypothetical protein